MKNLVVRIVVLALVFAGVGAYASQYEYDTEGGKYSYSYPYYVVDVPNAASNSLASGAFAITEVLAAGNSGSTISYATFKTKTSGTLIKTGGGILELNEALSNNWAGANHVMEGTLLVRCNGALGKVVATGSRAGDADATFVHSGATIYMFNVENEQRAEKKKIVFEGTGVDGRGAMLVNAGNGNSTSWTLGTDPTLLGDAKFRLLRSGILVNLTFNPSMELCLNGHTATIVGEAANAGSVFMHNNSTVAAGHIVMDNASYVLYGTMPTFLGDEQNTLTLRNGSRLGFRAKFGGSKTVWTLVVADNARAYSDPNNAADYDPDDETGRTWVGPVVLNGNLRIDNRGEEPGKWNYRTRFGFTGYVSGPGGFFVNSATGDNRVDLHLACETNAFRGAIGVDKGLLSLHANGALPVDCAGLYLTNSTLRLLADTAYNLPATVVSGTGTITNASSGTSCKVVFDSLAKEGSGTLTNKADIVISNTLTVASTSVSADTPAIIVEGTLRFEEGAEFNVTGDAKSRGNYPFVYASGGITGLPVSKTSGYSVYLDADGKTLILTYGGGTWPDATAAATWIGGGSDSLMTTMGNWQGPPESLDLTSGTLAVNVAAGGEMKYSGTKWVASITNDVNLLAADAGTNNPLWIVPENENDMLVLSRGINSGSGKNQIVLKGHIALPHGVSGGSASGVSGNPCAIRYIPKSAKISDSAVPAGIIEGQRPSDGQSRWSAPLVLAGARVDPPLSVVGAYQAISILGYTGTSNVVNGAFVSSTNQSAVGVMAGSTIDFRGGFAPWYRYRMVGSGSSGANVGTVRITDTPMQIAREANKTKTIDMQDYVRLVFDAEGCYVSDGILIEAGLLEFARNGCFADGSTRLMENYHTAFRPTQIEFNSTTQRFSTVTFYNTHNSSWFHGTYPAMMELTCVHYGTNTTTVSTNAIPINGGLGVHVCGTGTLYMAKQDYASCGDLEASAGALVLCSDATWLNGTNFTARGTGCLKFTKAGQVNSAVAKVRLADEGTIDIPAGVTLAVQSLEVGSGGEWGPVETPRMFDASSTGPMAGRVTGGGTLRVLGNKNYGLIILVR